LDKEGETCKEMPEAVPLTEKELMEMNVASYRSQVSLQRMPVSEAIKELIDYVQKHQDQDHCVNDDYPPKKENPWVETKKCSIL